MLRGSAGPKRDVGTSAISLCLERRIPVQLNDKDHYCTRAHGFTSSAAPVFGQPDELLGIMVASGSANLVHPHTLIMIASTARSVGRQVLILRRNKQLALNMGFLDSIIESAGMGLIALDRDLKIWRVNQRGKKILGLYHVNRKPVSVLGDMRVDLNDIRENPGHGSIANAILVMTDVKATSSLMPGPSCRGGTRARARWQE